MFTGIITGLGAILSVKDLAAPVAPATSSAAAASSGFGKQLSLQTPPGYLADVGLGDSIAINGACMTVTVLDPTRQQFCVDISAESLARTVGLDQPGLVNLEKALRANDRLGGHMVSGHVDGLGEVSHFASVGESWQLRVLVPAPLARFMAYKGSVAINGVSLTVNSVSDLAQGCEISINLIPHTVQNTSLHTLRVGARVNLEVDLIARYCERLLSQAR